jgi:hypothetical protein
MAWDIAITLAAIALLVLFHAWRAPADVATAPAGAPAPRPPPRSRDPWARVLVAAALAAALLALGVVIVPAIW